MPPANCSAGAVALPLFNVTFWSDACLLDFACPLECKIVLLAVAAAALALLVATLVRIVRLCRGLDATRYAPIDDAASGAPPAAGGAARGSGSAARAAFAFEKRL